jgi:hypothetical protein
MRPCGAELHPWSEDLRAKYPGIHCSTDWDEPVCHIFVRGSDYCECGLLNQRNIRPIGAEEGAP